MLLGRKKILRPDHEEPGDFWLNYILLPYGEFYDKTKVFLSASPGDTLRFFNGPDYPIVGVSVIPSDRTCNFLCKMRYGITWDKALERWTRYARMEGHGKDVLSREKCIIVFYDDAED